MASELVRAKIFCAPKNNNKIRSGTFLPPPTAFCHHLEAKVVPQIFFPLRPNAKLDKEIHQYFREIGPKI